MAGYNLSNYPGGFPSGITIRNLPIIQTNPGRVFWLDNSALGNADHYKNGSDGNRGNFDAPFATLSYAISQTRANKGDIIFVKPGHAETIASAGAVSFSKAGVAIIGLGTGSNRPTFTWSTLATATMLFAASNVTLQNLLFVSTMATGFTTTAFSIAAAVVANDITIDNCEFRDSSATTGFLGLVTQAGTTANALDGFTFTNNKVFHNLTTVTNVVAAVTFTGAVDRLNFSNNSIVQLTANNNVALGFAAGANALTNATISGNRTASVNTGTTAGELFSGSSTACSGLVSDNYSGHLAATGLLAPIGTKLKFIQNFCHITGAADKSALINPAAV